MIGSGLTKLAKQYGLTVSDGVAYGSLMGYATTLSEGAGYKRIDITTRFTQLGQQETFMAAVNAVDVTKQYRVQKLGVGTRKICVIFNDTIGTMKKLEAFIGWFYPLMRQHGLTGAEICTECGTQIEEGDWYLIDGVAHHYHAACAERVQTAVQDEAQQRRDEDTGSYATGALGALVGAVMGAVVWAVVLSLGYVASLIGFLIGWLAEKGYNLCHGKQGKGKIVILILAIIFGVLLGTVAPDAVELAKMINAGDILGYTYADIPLLMVILLVEDSSYLAAVAGNGLMGLLFAALGVFALLKKTKADVSGTKIKKLK